MPIFYGTNVNETIFALVCDGKLIVAQTNVQLGLISVYVASKHGMRVQARFKSKNVGGEGGGG